MKTSIVCDMKLSLPCSSLCSEIDTIEINSLFLFEMMMSEDINYQLEISLDLSTTFQHGKIVNLLS